MVGYLIEKNDNYYCSECRMKQRSLKEKCYFCDTLFSNFEEMLIKKFKQENNYSFDNKLKL